MLVNRTGGSLMKLTFRDWLKMSRRQRGENYQFLNDHDKLLARMQGSIDLDGYDDDQVPECDKEDPETTLTPEENEERKRKLREFFNKITGRV